MGTPHWLCVGGGDGGRVPMSHHPGAPRLSPQLSPSPPRLHADAEAAPSCCQGPTYQYIQHCDIHTYSYVRDQPAQAPFPGGDGAVHAVAPCAHGVSRTSEGRAALHSSGGSIPCGGVGVVCSAPAVRGAIRGGSRSSRAALRRRGRGGTSARQYVPRIAADARCPLVPCINSLWTFLRPPTHPPLAVTCVR